MPESKTVLVTGGLGYIGSVLTSYLQEHGFRVIVYDTGFFKDCCLYAPPEAEIRLRDARQFQVDDLTGVDAVVHLAGISNDPFGNLRPETIYDPTRAYALRIAKLCKEAGVKFVFASSCSVYGKGAGGLLNEASSTSPQTPYSLNKLQVEGDLRAICEVGAFSPIILRFATVYGLSPRMRFDLVINMFVGMALTTRKIILNSDGKAWRPNVHVQDVVKAIKASVELDYSAGEPLTLNVGDTGDNYQVLDIAAAVQKRLPDCEISFLSTSSGSGGEAEGSLIRDRKIQDGVDIRTYEVSFERIKEVVPGFRCDHTLETGISSMIDAAENMGLTEEQFKNIDFYRLQKIESLWNSGLISEDLYWKTLA